MAAKSLLLFVYVASLDNRSTDEDPIRRTASEPHQMPSALSERDVSRARDNGAPHQPKSS